MNTKIHACQNMDDLIITKAKISHHATVSHLIIVDRCSHLPYDNSRITASRHHQCLVTVSCQCPNFMCVFIQGLDALVGFDSPQLEETIRTTIYGGKKEGKSVNLTFNIRNVQCLKLCLYSSNCTAFMLQ